MNVKRIPVSGNPVAGLISTSHVEKQNHTLRMHCRRLTRLTNAFSKKLENFKAAVALHYACHNFVKSNIAIRLYASNGRWCHKHVLDSPVQPRTLPTNA